MKRLLSILLAAIALISLQSCVQIFDDTYSAKVITLEATDISYEGYTFNASIDWRGSAAVTGQGGVFYGSSAGVTDKNSKFSSSLMDLRGGVNMLHSSHKNYRELFVKEYYFKEGETVYYRAFAKVFTAEGKTEYIFGEEKSFTIPTK